MTFKFPHAVLAQHSAFLGKTGSGKTSTAKKAVEQILQENPAARVCVLDPTKSDWWGMTSSADGRRPGLPFCILGGPRGHVPLHDSAGKAIGELVASGDLPLSIIDMSDFNAGGLQKFFNDFAPALMRRMRGVVYLVIEEAHEFAPKERAGIGAENLAIHNAKKLATAGRSKGIRLMVVTQRTQALHNAVLGSCDTMIAHRLTAPADQEPVKKWLKANVDKATFERVSTSLSSLKTGTAWLCSGEAQVADLVQIPKISTFDNSATPTGDMADQQVQTAPVDRDRLRAIIGDAVRQAEQDDPSRLRAEIARLTALTKAPTNIPDATQIAAAEQRGYSRGFALAERQIRPQFEALKQLAASTVKSFSDAYQANILGEKLDLVALAFPPSGSPARDTASAPKSPASTPAARKPSPAASGDGAVQPREMKVLEAIARWKSIGFAQPSRVQVAFLAGYTASGGGYRNILGALRTSGHLNYPNSEALELTETGVSATSHIDSFSRQDLAAGITQVLDPREKRVLDQIMAHYPKRVSRAAVASETGYEPTGGGYRNILGKLRSVGLIQYPDADSAIAEGWLFQ